MTPSEIHKSNVRFPELYARLIRLLQIDLMPWHFYDIFVLGLIGLAFLFSVLNMGGVYQHDAIISARLVAAAAGMHIFGKLSRSVHGFRLRWTGALLLPAAIWLCADLYLRGDSWRGGEQMAIMLTSLTAMWVVAHHQRHLSAKWFFFGGMGMVASVFGMLVINADHNLLPRLAGRMVSPVYQGQATGPFATPGEFGAFLLLSAFPAAAVLVSPSLRYRRRVAAGYVTILAVIGLYCTHHAPSWYGALAGAAVLALMLIRSQRMACLATAFIAGLALLVPRFNKTALLDSGIFRSDARVTPMVDVSIDVFRMNPVFGVGPGNFASAFETVRPAGFNYDPMTAGGFFTNLLAEGGLIGLALLALPGIALWIALFLRTHREDVRLVRRDRQFGTKKSYVPEPRLAGAAILSATLAATVSLSMDYARPSLAISLAFAIYGAVAVHILFKRFGSTVVHAQAKPNLFLRALLGFTPLVAIFFFVFPVFVTSAKARFAEDILLRVEEAGKATGLSKTSLDRRKQWIALGIENAEEALRVNPDNVRAAAVLAELLTARYRIVGDASGLSLAFSYAQHAATLAPNEPIFTLPLLTLTGMTGNPAEYDRLLADMRAKAPANGPLALEQARRHISSNRPAEARAIVETMRKREPWNAEVRRLDRLLKITADSAAR